jgi:hypothetical protein
MLRYLGERTGTSERGKVMEKAGRMVNMVQKMCIHACKCKMIAVETIPGIWGERDEGEKQMQ